MTRTPRLPARRLVPALPAFCAAALWNPWSWDWFLGSGSLESRPVRMVLLAIGVALFLWGLQTLLGRPLRLAVRVHVVLLTSFLLLPLAVEAGVRTGLAFPDSSLRDPALFSDPYSEDDYWKLNYDWQAKRPRHRASDLDPLLGWSRHGTRLDPLGIHRPLGYTPRTEDVVLCFGDSYMASKPDHPHKLPDVLEQHLPGRVAYNFGGGGYGVGQIYLRFRENHAAFDDPIVVIGIMRYDLDRTILSVRSAPKPRFRLRDGELTLERPQVPDTLEQWYPDNPPEIRSFALSWLVHARPSGLGLARESYRREEKRELNRAIIEQLIREAREHELRLLFITFPTRRLGPDWRRDLLADVFDSNGVPWVEGAAVLKAQAGEESIDPRTYFGSDNHPNARGNQILGEALAARVTELWGES